MEIRPLRLSAGRGLESRVGSDGGGAAMLRITGRRGAALALAAALALGGADFNRAYADGGKLIEGLAGLALLAVGGAALAVVGAVALAKAADDPGARAAADAQRPARDSAQAARDAQAAVSQREFLAMPRCDTVGGYEEYRRRTGEVCRLY
jgi:hypothetical protein